MSEHPIVKVMKECTEDVRKTTKALIEGDKSISTQKAAEIARQHNASASKYNALLKMAIFNAQHHPGKEIPYLEPA